MSIWERLWTQTVRVGSMWIGGTFIEIFVQRPCWSPFCLLSTVSSRKDLRRGLLVASALSRHNLRSLLHQELIILTIWVQEGISPTHLPHSLGGRESFSLNIKKKNSLSATVVCVALSLPSLNQTWDLKVYIWNLNYPEIICYKLCYCINVMAGPLLF